MSESQIFLDFLRFDGRVLEKGGLTLKISTPSKCKASKFKSSKCKLYKDVTPKNVSPQDVNPQNVSPQDVD